MDNRVTAVSFFLGTTVCATVALQLAPPLRDGLRVALRDCCATAAALLRDRVTASPARPQPNAPRPSTSYSLVCRPQRPAVGDSVPADRRAPRRPSAPRVTLASRRNESQRIAASLSTPHPHARVRRSPRRQARGWSEERRSEAAGGACDDGRRATETAAQAAEAAADGRDARTPLVGYIGRRWWNAFHQSGGVVPAERGACWRVGRRGVGQRGRSVLARCAGGPSRAGGLCGLKAPGTSPVRNDLSRLVVA